MILALLASAMSALSGLWTDLLWFRSVGFTEVFTGRIGAQLLLGGGAFLVTAAVVWSSMWLAHRHRPVYPPTTPQEVALDQYRSAIEPLRRGAQVGIPLLLGGMVGLSAATQWQTLLQWQHQVPFGQVDPQFGKDLGFFVFSLPWWRFVGNLLTMVLVLGIVIALVAHYLYGGLQLPGRPARTTTLARNHVAVLAAAAVLVRAAMYWLDRYQLAVTDSRLLTGITYTRDHAVIPTKAILAAAAVICALLFLACIITRSWRLPLLGVALLTVTAVVAGGAYPALVQTLKVRPSEKSLEAEYIKRSITATRQAYGIGEVKATAYDARSNAQPGQLRADAATVPGIRIMDPNVVSPAFGQLQATRAFYTMPDALDIDRYPIDGRTQDTVVSVRELDVSRIPSPNWLNEHTVYTHGTGFIGAYGTRRTAEGDPVFFEHGYQPTGTLGTYEPRVYFGEKSPDYSIVGAAPGARPREFDAPDSSDAGQRNTTYTGQGGVAVGSVLRKLAYAIKYREPKFLLSDAVNDHSRLLDHRTPLERVQRVAPWLTTDGNVYPAVIDGRIQWIVDGYTTSASYPYSRLQELDDATSDSVTDRADTVQAAPAKQVNYIRNSVKATVDAYDGSVRLYAWDTADPVLRTWQRAFPGTVRPISQISGQLMSHLRYPQDLFKVQRSLLTRYHVGDPNSFYDGTDFWRVPKDPTLPTRDQPPYYLSLAMPGEKAPRFSLTSSFIPTGDRNLLTSFLAVDADPGRQAGLPRQGYGQLRLLQVPRDNQVMGPGQVQQQIETSDARSQDESEPLTLSQYLTQNRQGAKHTTLGNLLTFPVGEGFLYVQPVYVRAENEQGSYPRAKVVVTMFGKDLAWASTLDKALDGLFGGNSGVTAGDSGVAPGSDPTTKKPAPKTGKAALTAAIEAAQKAQADADAALKKGDFTAYGEAQKRLDEAIAAAAQAAKGIR